MADKDKIVVCAGCGGNGVWRLPLGRERRCKPCQGFGQLRLKAGEVWCGRCSGTGELEAGIPGAVSFRSCSFCNGRGRRKI